ncbi:MAG: hypothetical protein P8J01_00855 [Acidimicrobiales bacterium]|nr:hypothetical protein [Acidimicrobiales bacterium]
MKHLLAVFGAVNLVAGLASCSGSSSNNSSSQVEPEVFDDSPINSNDLQLI